MNSDSGRKFAIYPSKKPSKAEFNSSILKHLDLTSNFSYTNSLCVFGKKKKRRMDDGDTLTPLQWEKYGVPGRRKNRIKEIIIHVGENHL